MADGTVAVLQSTDPAAKLIDNDTFTLSGTLVNRQRTVAYPPIISTASATYTTSGAHTLITPGSGHYLETVWVFVQAKAVLDTGTVSVTLTLGSSSYTFELTGSQMVAHAARWRGAVDAVFVVTTSSTAAVVVNVDYLDVTP